MEEDIYTYRRALEDFKWARSKAAMQRFWASIKGESLDLLPYAEISSKLRAVSQSNLGLQDVPLKQIVGSVGRVDDFDRNFNPLRDSDRHRWASVKTAMISPMSKGVPPVHLYKIGEMYFVLDGNHRVSIAKEIGSKSIEAYVTEVRTKVSVDASLTTEDLVRKAAYADFLEDTQIDSFLPGISLSLNFIQNYNLLKEHIAVHQYYMGIERSAPVPYAEAVKHWYDFVYQPVINAIENVGLANIYPDMTLTDLYLYVLDQQTSIQQELGLNVSTENAIDFVAMKDGKLPEVEAAKANVMKKETAEQLLDAEACGCGAGSINECLFRDILVGIGDFDPDWIGLTQATLVNRCPGGQIRGLHVSPAKNGQSSSESDQLQDEFYRRLSQAGMAGRFSVISGEVTRKLKEQSLLSDLLVLKLRYAPSGGLFDRTGSGIAQLIQQGRRPILLVKEKALPIEHVLLLYDGQPKSKEALYVAAYYALKMKTRLDILTIEDEPAGKETQINFAREYLAKFGIDYGYQVVKGGEFVNAVLTEIERVHPSTLMAGGYNGTSWLGRMFGTSLDALLEAVDIPTLICL